MSKPFPFAMWPHDAGIKKAEVNLMYETDSGRTFSGNGNRMNRRSRAGSIDTLLPGDSAPKVEPSAASQPAPETSSPSSMGGSNTTPAISKPISGGAASMANAAYARMMQRKRAAASSPSSAGPTSTPNLSGPTSSPGSGSPSQTQEQRMRRYANLSADIGPNFTTPKGENDTDLASLEHRYPRIFTADSPGLESWGEHYDRTGESREPTEQEYILNRQRGQDLLRDVQNAVNARMARRPEPGPGPKTIPTVGQLAQYSKEYKGRSGNSGR